MFHWLSCKDDQFVRATKGYFFWMFAALWMPPLVLLVNLLDSVRLYEPYWHVAIPQSISALALGWACILKGAQYMNQAGEHYSRWLRNG